ncbi:MAG: SDR family NAD(P)-dependent oxidoreductase [Leucobacter sp.]
MTHPPEPPLAGRRVLVTGGSRGLGRGIAEAMAGAGARVAIASRTREQVDRAAAEIPGATGHVFDVGDIAGIPALVDEVEAALGGGLSTVVHAAGTQHRQPAEDFDIEAFRRVLEVNLVAPFALSQEIGRRQLDRESGGQHIFIGIAPGYFRAELTEAVFADEEWRRSSLGRIPMARFGEASDVGGVAVFLASEAAGYVTGQMLPVDGGWLAA